MYLLSTWLETTEQTLSVSECAFVLPHPITQASLMAQWVKNPPAMIPYLAGNACLIPGLGRSPGE